MRKGLTGFIQSIPVIDVHEHHMPEETPGRQIGLLQILEESYAGWTQKRPYPLPDEPPVTLGSVSSSKGTWADIESYVQGSGTNAAVRNMVRALCELYVVKAGEITEGNWEMLDAEIRRRNADPSWSATVMDRAGVEIALSDPGQVVPSRRGAGHPVPDAPRLCAHQGLAAVEGSGADRATRGTPRELTVRSVACEV
jgi:hypothetical protein